SQRSRFIIDGVFADENGDEPVLYIQELLVPLLKPWAEIRFQIEQIKFKSSFEVSVIINSNFVAGNKHEEIKAFYGNAVLPNKELVKNYRNLIVSVVSATSADLKDRHVSERQCTGVRQALAAITDNIKCIKRYDKSTNTGSAIAAAAT
ncbi:5263_t:CDS:1, partial [Racocetra fulgida]